MPFWWRRRRRFFFPKNRYNRYTRRYRKKRWPRRRRRRPRRAPRRRRRRRKYKVRRKKKKINIQQWQPDSIVHCKIKGLTTLVLGAEGKQLVCYTNVKQSNTPAKAPGGGGFGCEQFSLDYLYREYTFRKNIWTKSNILKDLVRYLGVKCIFYRHPETDFIVSYSRQPPFEYSKELYTQCHPLNLLLSKHKIIIPSKFTNPKGKLKIKRFIKPPKQMLTKWFFQEHFTHYPLVLIQAAACNLNYNNLGCCNTNQMCTFFYINPGFYILPNWWAKTQKYLPYQTFPTSGVYTWTQKQLDTLSQATDNQKFAMPTDYNQSISYEKGFFTKQLLEAVLLTKTKDKDTATGTTPLNVCRYNPNLDSGKGNSIWLVSGFANSYREPPSDKTLIYQGLPLYQMLYGFLSYVQAIKKGTFLQTYILAMRSPALLPASQIGAEKNIIIPIDNKFPHGKAPYDEDLTSSMKATWVPNVYNQLEVLNTIVESGPLVPKYSQTKNSTWELDMFYTFHFKWGGPEVTDTNVADPALQGHYEVPDTFQRAVQIANPGKQKAASLLHPWDIRHGYFTKTALKRMYSNLSIDTDFQPDQEESPQKKRKRTGPELSYPQEEEEEIQSCLLSLCEKSTWQEQEENNLLQLIKQQQQQQQELKYNLLRIISDIKDKQNLLRLQTGFVV
nr:MAG: ORF1 [Torque teno midi virus]